MRDSAKVFCKGLHVQLVMKLLCLETFMVVTQSVTQHEGHTMCNP